MIIPEDWRELDALEQIKVGDLWLDGVNWWEVGDGDVGNLACSMMTMVIRKKGDAMNRDDPAIPPGWERVPYEELITAGHMYWHPWRQEWREYDLHHGICTAGDYEKRESMVIRKKVTQ